MTREEAKKEAIAQLERISRNLASIGETVDYTEFAIEALEQEPVYFPPCVDCNTKMNEIREAYDKLKPYKVKRAFKMGWDGKKERALMGGRCECGQYISDEDKYCRKCGRPLDWGAVFGEREVERMRLIDADAIINTLGCSDRDIYVKACIEEDAPTVPAVPLDRIKEAITALDSAYEELDGYDPDALGTYKCRVDEVFSKLIAEVEG